MFTKVSYTKLKKQYPDQVAEVEAKIKRSKNRLKNEKPNTFTWGFNWGVGIAAMNIGEFVQQVAKERRDPTEDEAVADYKTRVFASVSAIVGSTTYCSDGNIPCPKEIEDNYRKSLRAEAADKVRFAALTPEQRQNEINDLLSQLRGPGFMEINL